MIEENLRQRWLAWLYDLQRNVQQNDTIWKMIADEDREGNQFSSDDVVAMFEYLIGLLNQEPTPQENELLNKAAIIISDSEIFLEAFKKGNGVAQSNKLVILERLMPLWLKEWTDLRISKLRG